MRRRTTCRDGEANPYRGSPRSKRFVGTVLMPSTMLDAALAARSGQFKIAGAIEVNRLGFGAMRVTGRGIWGPPKDRNAALATLKRAPELGVNFIDTGGLTAPAFPKNSSAKRFIHMKVSLSPPRAA